MISNQFYLENTILKNILWRLSETMAIAPFEQNDVCKMKFFQTVYTDETVAWEFLGLGRILVLLQKYRAQMMKKMAGRKTKRLKPRHSMRGMNSHSMRGKNSSSSETDFAYSDAELDFNSEEKSVEQTFVASFHTEYHANYQFSTTPGPSENAQPLGHNTLLLQPETFHEHHQQSLGYSGSNAPNHPEANIITELSSNRDSYSDAGTKTFTELKTRKINPQNSLVPPQSDQQHFHDSMQSNTFRIHQEQVNYMESRPQPQYHDPSFDQSSVQSNGGPSKVKTSAKSSSAKSSPTPKRHTPKNQCPHCDYKSSDHSNLKRHVALHFSQRDFVCNICGASFHAKKTLTTHFKYKHSDVRPFSCSSCGLGFKTKNSLTRHMKVHTNSKDHQCGKCHMSFNRMSNFRRHMKLVHDSVNDLPAPKKVKLVDVPQGLEYVKGLKRDQLNTGQTKQKSETIQADAGQQESDSSLNIQRQEESVEGHDTESVTTSTPKESIPADTQPTDADELVNTTNYIQKDYSELPLVKEDVHDESVSPASHEPKPGETNINNIQVPNEISQKSPEIDIFSGEKGKNETSLIEEQTPQSDVASSEEIIAASSRSATDIPPANTRMTTPITSYSNNKRVQIATMNSPSKTDDANHQKTRDIAHAKGIDETNQGCRTNEERFDKRNLRRYIFSDTDEIYDDYDDDDESSTDYEPKLKKWSDMKTPAFRNVEPINYKSSTMPLSMDFKKYHLMMQLLDPQMNGQVLPNSSMLPTMSDADIDTKQDRVDVNLNCYRSANEGTSQTSSQDDMHSKQLLSLSMDEACDKPVCTCNGVPNVAPPSDVFPMEPSNCLRINDQRSSEPANEFRSIQHLPSQELFSRKNHLISRDSESQSSLSTVSKDSDVTPTDDKGPSEQPQTIDIQQQPTSSDYSNSQEKQGDPALVDGKVSSDDMGWRTYPMCARFNDDLMKKKGKRFYFQY